MMPVAAVPPPQQYRTPLTSGVVGSLPRRYPTPAINGTPQKCVLGSDSFENIVEMLITTSFPNLSRLIVSLCRVSLVV